MSAKSARHRLCASCFDVKKTLQFDPGILGQNGGVYAANASRSNDSGLV